MSYHPHPLVDCRAVIIGCFSGRSQNIIYEAKLVRLQVGTETPTHD